MMPNKKIAYTIVTERYLCFAYTLKESFLKHNSNVDFIICLITEEDQGQNYKYDHIITTSILDQTAYSDMRKRYDNLALVCALKPYFANYFLNNKNIESIVYLDADINVYNSFDYLFDLLGDKSDKSSIIITPHVLNKLGAKDIVRNINYLTYGTYNAGFFAVKNNENGKKFIEWWEELLFQYCKNDLKYGFFYDQVWLNLVPNYFYDYYLLLIHPGYNVAYWNVDERDISKRNNIYFCKDEPLVFYHFARFNYYDHHITKNIDEINPLMTEIYTKYKNSLQKMGIEKSIINKAVSSSKSQTMFTKFKRLFKL